MTTTASTSNYTIQELTGIASDVVGVTEYAYQEEIPSRSVEILADVTAAIRLYYQIFISLLGLCGNLLTVMVMTRKRQRDKTTSYYIIAIAVADSGVLVISTIWWMSRYVNINSVWSCKLVITIFYACAHFSVTTLMAVATERFVVVQFPLKASVWVTKTKTRIILFCIGLFTIAVDFQNFFTRTMIITPSNKTACLFSNLATDATKYVYFHLYIWPYLDALVYCFIPLCYIFLFNILIITSLVRASRHQRHLTEAQDNGSSAQRQVTIMLLSVTTAFLILTTPIAVTLILEKLWNFRGSHYTLAIWSLLRAITANLMYTQHAVNFLLYYASNMSFRKEFKAMFKGDIHKEETSAKSISKTSN